MRETKIPFLCVLLKKLENPLIPKARIMVIGPALFVFLPWITPVSYTHLDVYKRQFVEIPKVGNEIEGKMIYKSKIKLQENDFLVVTSDGAIHAGIGSSLNFGWEQKDIIQFLEQMYEMCIRDSC